MLWLASILGIVAVGSAIMIDFESDDEETEDNDVTAEADTSGSTIVSPEVFLSGGQADEDPVEDVSTTVSGDAETDTPQDGGIEDGGVLIGSDELDHMSGSDADDALLGLGGDDQINGLGGDDSLEGGAGDDDLYGGEGQDTLEGGDDNDTLNGGTGQDSLAGGAGDDSLLGGLGTDRIQGDEGDDTLHGGSGNDHVQGGAGNDAIHGNDDDDMVFGGTGEDALFGGRGNDVVSGADDGAEKDFVNGGDGDDTLIAGASDVVTVGDGADQILLGDWIAAGTVELIDFDTAEDQLLLVYDGDQGVPDLELEPDPAAPGETILRLDGEIAMRLTGAEGLTTDDIFLVEADDGDVAHLPLPQ
ncbi:calcium-binding protein [Tritonibacter mobilis]|uniref:Type I secretion protein n=1 Tax=Tritonibacter mobilis F1926 TaxID=1265309 RepID=A0A1B0ZY27_9RHOB|nr:calcium-binding protein [Tritonibacter mobilis]ANP39233.1 type I secretion protein [Tritonibacter mobilis F1926]KJZ24734.1 type I secretion protein [Tritonibacter mobilis]